MTAAEKEREWIRRYGDDPRVVRWLAANPPPLDWTGTPEQWAYLEMLFAPGWFD